MREEGLPVCVLRRCWMQASSWIVQARPGPAGAKCRDRKPRKKGLTAISGNGRGPALSPGPEGSPTYYPLSLCALPLSSVAHFFPCLIPSPSPFLVARLG